MPQRKSIDALIARKEEIEQQIEAAKRGEAAARLVKTPEFKFVAKQVRELNLTASEIADLFNVMEARKPRKATTIPAKYKHPTDPELTWSGRGRKPVWVQQWTENGKSMNDLLISKQS